MKPGPNSSSPNARRVALAALVLLAVTGCATPNPPSNAARTNAPSATVNRSPSGSPSPTAAPDPSWPKGREFTTTVVTEAGAQRALVAGTTLTVTFGAPYELYIQAGCNQLSVKSHIEGGRIIPDTFAATAIGCDPARLAQDAWLVSFFTAKPTWQVAGNELRLATDTAEIHLTRTP